MIEAGVVLVRNEPVFWHLPAGRTGGSLPDSRKLWDVLWELRKEVTLGVAHSHPGFGVPGPSWTDITTFAAVELGLGRRLAWPIITMDHVAIVRWTGPGKHDYKGELAEEFSWVPELRNHSKEK